MPNCTEELFHFPSFDRRKIEANFQGGEVSSDGGLMVVREADRRLGLTRALNAALPDPRHPVFITHEQITLVRQRIYGLALGYEDLNDHDTLRRDLVWQSAVDRDTELGSSPTLCRLENRASRASAVAMHRVLVEQFVASFGAAPTELVLDFDATDDRVHGQQEGRAFHAYYGDVFPALVCVLRRATAGELSAPEQPGRGPTCVGGAQAPGHAAAPSVAAGEADRAGR